MAPSRTVDVWCTIAPDPLEFLTYKGAPSGTPQKKRYEELQLTHDDVRQMQTRIIGLPVRYNHKDHIEELGRVTGTRVCASGKGEWDVKLTLSSKTAPGEVVLGRVLKGEITGVSLRHILGSNIPEEVSICFDGARGPESRIHAPTKSGQYTGNSDERYVICASLHATERPEGRIRIFRVVCASASAMGDVAPPPAAAGAPAAGAPPAAAPAGEQPALTPEEQEAETNKKKKKAAAEAEAAAAAAAAAAASPPADAPMADAEAAAALPATAATEQLLLGKGNGILSKAERVGQIELVADLEEANLNAKSEIEKLKAELEAAKAEAEREKQKAAMEAQLASDAIARSAGGVVRASTDHEMATDAVDSFVADPTAAAELKRVLASGGAATTKAFAMLAQGMAAEATKVTPELSVTQKRVRAYKAATAPQATAAAAAAATSTPAGSTMHPAFGRLAAGRGAPAADAASSPVSVLASNGGAAAAGIRNVPAVLNPQNPMAPHERPFRQTVVSASGHASHVQQAAGPSWPPGQGLNFSPLRPDGTPWLTLDQFSQFGRAPFEEGNPFSRFNPYESEAMSMETRMAYRTEMDKRAKERELLRVSAARPQMLDARI